MDKMTRLQIVFAGFILLFMLQPEARAEMYVCVDAAGKVQYTNMNFSASCRPLRKRIGITKRPTSQRYSTVVSSFGRPQQNSSSYDHHISRSSRLYNVDPFLIKAVIKAESDFDSFALSKTGAQGLMQLMPETARELDVRNPYNPYENIDGGTRYLRNMLDIFDGNVSLSLAAYNAGPTLVRRLMKIPRIPETVRYVKKVLAHYENYKGHSLQTQVRLATANEKL